MKSPFLSIALSALALSTAAADESFSRYDTNGDGMVTYEELARAKKLEFDKLDRNRDRYVSIEEFDTLKEESASEYDFFHSANFEFPEGAVAISSMEYGEQIRQIISRLDTTADNAVSEEEYSAAVADAKAAASVSLILRKGSGPKSTP